MRRSLITGFGLGVLVTCVTVLVVSVMKDSSRRSSVSSVSSSMSPQLLIYNRLPKTASTSFMRLPYELSSLNNFHVALINNSRTPNWLSFEARVSLVLNVSEWSSMHPLLLHGHFPYVNFESYSSLAMRPMYINVIREPLDRLVSYYYFLRYGDDYRPHVRRSRMGDETSFDECVLNNAGNHSHDCHVNRLWLQVPWFCGHHKRCWEPGSRWALETAKRNVVEKYFLVGITNDLLSFIKLLEKILPSFFKGAFQLYEKEGEVFRRTRFKRQPSERVRAKLMDTNVGKMEHEFYTFVTQQFNAIKEDVLKDDDGDNLGYQGFHFEKIRPTP